MSCLLADIGGTNTQCAVTDADGKIEKIQSFRNSEFSDPASLLGTYLHSVEVGQRPDRAMLAVAAPIRGDIVNMINIEWQFSANSLQNQLGFKQLNLLNDFEALARALPEFRNGDVLKIGSGVSEADKPQSGTWPGNRVGRSGIDPGKYGLAGNQRGGWPCKPAGRQSGRSQDYFASPGTIWTLLGRAAGFRSGTLATALHIARLCGCSRGGNRTTGHPRRSAGQRKS